MNFSRLVATLNLKPIYSWRLTIFIRGVISTIEITAYQVIQLYTSLSFVIIQMQWLQTLDTVNCMPVIRHVESIWMDVHHDASLTAETLHL